MGTLPESRCVVVIGQHRGGTSTVAGVLHNAGVVMGRRLLPADSSNPSGYYEDMEFLELHQRLLSTGKGSFDEWVNPPKEIRKGPKRAYRELIRRKAGQPLWGVKDPRLCFLLPTFLEFVQSQVLLVSVHRPREAAEASLVKRETVHGRKIDADLAKRICLRYRSAQVDAETHVITKYGADHLLQVDYNHLVEQPMAGVVLLTQFVGVRALKAAIRFVDKDLRHHV